jgi:hypothetical protein
MGVPKRVTSRYLLAGYDNLDIIILYVSGNEMIPFRFNRHFTREALPRMDNYRNIMSIQAAYRPTLDELHNATLPQKVGLRVLNLKISIRRV